MEWCVTHGVDYHHTALSLMLDKDKEKAQIFWARYEKMTMTTDLLSLNIVKICTQTINSLSK